jgi:predicted RNase H-like HicB family nuclease
MAVFIAVIKRDGEATYTASFPDFPELAVDGPTLDRLLAKAGEVLALHIERLLEVHRAIAVPTPADAIERGDALLLAAVHVPDDVGITDVELALPALSLARIDSIARRLGLTRSALFVQAVNRWEIEMAVPRDRRAAAPDGPTLFDFVTPLELRVEAPATAYPPLPAVNTQAAEEGATAQVSLVDIEAELERLIEESSGPKPDDAIEGRPVKEVKGE